MAAETFVVAGTDTDVGKTVFSAMLTLALEGCYWKPVQSGLQDGTDREKVRRLTGLPEDRLLPERHLLSAPLSPHRAAELDGVEIDIPALAILPETPRPLIVEPAGGLMAPLTRSVLQIDLLAGWGAPVVLCARTRLGTINHSLLSVEALRRRRIPLLGIAFIGDPNEDNERTVCDLARTPRLGRLPWLPELGPGALARAFSENFVRESFLLQGVPACR